MVNVISFFSGCGGSSLGYRRAGCRVLLACDWERRAVDTYALNFPETRILHADIRKVTRDDIMRETEGAAADVDIVDGSPPCTPFSMSGRRQRSWGRSYVHAADSSPQRADDLFFEFVRLVGELRPKCFVAENVKGLVAGKAKGYYKRILAAAGRLGYSMESFLLNAKDFDVPQSRERVFILGFREDVALRPAKLSTRPEITFLQATGGLVNPEEELEQARLKDAGPMRWARLQRPGQSRSEVDPRGHGFNSVRLSPGRPSCTLTTKDGYLHPIENRRLTLSEEKRLASFPDSFRFLSAVDGKARIGNCVPPNLIMHVAKYVVARAGLT